MLQSMIRAFANIIKDRMYRLPVSLQQIIDSKSPPSSDLHCGTHPSYQEFITGLDQFRVQQLPTDMKQFDCEIARNWVRWWPWLKYGLEAYRIFETESHPSLQIIHTVHTCAAPVISVLSIILSSSSTSPKRKTQASLACKIFVSPEFVELLSLAWVVAIIQPDIRRSIAQLLEDTMIESLLDADTLCAFASHFDTCCRRITGKPFIGLWRHHISTVVQETDDNIIIDDKVHLFLLLLRIPGNEASVFLNKANIVMKYLDRLWTHIMDLEDLDLTTVGTEIYSPIEIRIRCIDSLLGCYLVWLSGGARWVVVALDHNLIRMVEKTCRFLDGVRKQGSRKSAMRLVTTLRRIVEGVHRYKAYHAVARRVTRNLIRCAKRRSTLPRLRLGEGHKDKALGEAWRILKGEFHDTEAQIMRKALWRSAICMHCWNDGVSLV